MNTATASNAAGDAKKGSNGQPAPGHGWPRRQLIQLIFVVFIVHVALIFVFGARKPITPRQTKKVPQLTLADGQNELLALDDPDAFRPATRG